MGEETAIPRQNQDILFKSLTDAFAHKALSFYGLNTAPIVRAEKTELPRIEVKETRMDFVFLLEDDTYLHLEFQTAMQQSDLERFLKYDVALYESKRRPIRTAVICGKEIRQAPVRLNHGAVQYSIEAVYMNRYDGDRITQELKDKVQTQEKLDDLDQLNLIFLPLMNSGVSPSERALEAVELARRVKDESQQIFLVGAVVSISDKFIDKEYVQQLMEVMKMTRVGELLYKEGMKEGIKTTAQKMLRKGMDVPTITEVTGLSEQQVEELRKDLY